MTKDQPAAAAVSELHPGMCVRVARAAAMLGIGKTKLYELVGSGELETIRIGRRTLVLQSSIDALVSRLRRSPGSEGLP